MCRVYAPREYLFSCVGLLQTCFSIIRRERAARVPSVWASAGRSFAICRFTECFSLLPFDLLARLDVRDVPRPDGGFVIS
jgi:hypothetical protein